MLVRTRQVFAETVTYTMMGVLSNCYTVVLIFVSCAKAMNSTIKLDTKFKQCALIRISQIFIIYNYPPL